MKIKIIAIDKHKLSAAQELADEYIKRITWPIQIIDIIPKHKNQTKDAEGDLIEKHIDASQYLICLDENGDNFTSNEFAKTLDNIVSSSKDLTLIIGGATGISENILKLANKKIAFGRQTWPHKFVKFMLLEQIYRAQQIIKGHPYHKD